jgi:hypothetical protein
LHRADAAHDLDAVVAGLPVEPYPDFGVGDLGVQRCRRANVIGLSDGSARTGKPSRRCRRRCATGDGQEAGTHGWLRAHSHESEQPWAAIVATPWRGTPRPAGSPGRG